MYVSITPVAVDDVLQDRMPPEGPEVDVAREARKAHDADWTTNVTIITGHSLIDPINVDLFTKPEEGEVTKHSEDEILKLACAGVESTYAHKHAAAAAAVDVV